MPRYLFLGLFAGLFALSAAGLRYRVHASSMEGTTLLSLDSLLRRGDWVVDQSQGFGDVSKVGEHYLPNKPPGWAILLFPGRWTLNILGVKDPVLVYQFLLLIPCALAAACGTLSFILLMRLGLAPLPSYFSALGLVFATDLALYSGLLLRHAALAALLALALLSPITRSGRTGLFPFLAGLSLGGLVLMDYATLPLAAVLGLGLFLLHGRSQGGRASLIFLLGMSLPLLYLLHYNRELYGSPWLSGYSPEIYQGPPGIRWESLKAVFLERPLRGLIPGLLGLSRGWLLYCPPLALALWGLHKFGLKEAPPLEKWSLAAGLAYLVFISSFRYWHGGNFPGHRYLVPLPILLLPSWARILPLALRDNGLRVFLGFSALAAFAYRCFLIWTWGSLAESLAWPGQGETLGFPLLEASRLITDVRKLGLDPVWGAGTFQDLKWFLLAWGALLTAWVGLRARDAEPEKLLRLRSGSRRS